MIKLWDFSFVIYRNRGCFVNRPENISLKAFTERPYKSNPLYGQICLHIDGLERVVDFMKSIIDIQHEYTAFQ